MKRTILVLVTSMIVISCSTNLSTTGNKIRLIAEHQKIDCVSVGVVTGSSSMGATTGHNAENAMNEVRNKAADLKGNSLQIISTSTNSETSTVIGEAFNCKL